MAYIYIYIYNRERYRGNYYPRNSKMIPTHQKIWKNFKGYSFQFSHYACWNISKEVIIEPMWLLCHWVETGGVRERGPIPWGYPVPKVWILTSRTKRPKRMGVLLQERAFCLEPVPPAQGHGLRRGCSVHSFPQRQPGLATVHCEETQQIQRRNAFFSCVGWSVLPFWQFHDPAFLVLLSEWSKVLLYMLT